MSAKEMLSAIIFIVFWWLIYSLEVRYLIARRRRKVWPKGKFVAFIHVFAIAGVVCLLYAYFVEPYWIQVNHVDIATDKLKRSGFTVVQISDLHCDKKSRNEERLVTIVNKVNPDIVVFTGDSLNVPEALPTFKKTLKELKARLGKYAVRGNFDIWYWNNIDLFEGTGFDELNGRVVVLEKDGERLAISGASASNNFADLSFFKDVPNCYSIFLYHYPGINEELVGTPVDLYLSGHTHGGQIAIPFYGALVTLSKYGKKYESGKYRIGESILYVNRGIGMEGGSAPRVRFWARPEITVFHIHHSS